MEIFEGVNVGQNTAGRRIVLQIVDHPVHLVEHTFFVLVFHTQLIAVSLADGAVFAGPLVPHMAAQVCNPVGLLLPDPKEFIHGTLPIGAAQGHNGKLFFQVVTIHHTELLDSVGRGSVRPMRPHR